MGEGISDFRDLRIRISNDRRPGCEPKRFRFCSNLKIGRMDKGLARGPSDTEKRGGGKEEDIF